MNSTKTSIKIYLESRDQKRRAIEIAVVEADQGNFISSESMNAWLDSWGTADELKLPSADITK